MQNAEEHWDQVVDWVRLMIEAPEFDQWERNYKIDLGSRLSAVREQFLNGDDISSQLQAPLLARPAIPNWQEVDRLIKTMKSAPDESKNALALLWNKDLNVEDRIEGFSNAFPVDGYISTNLISALHLAMDPTDYPPYKPTAFSNAAKILQYELPRRNVRTDKHLIYMDALGLLDKIISESQSRGVQLRDRLDAQGVIWTFGTKSNGFDSWDEETRSTFARYVGASPEHDHAKSTPVVEDVELPVERVENRSEPISLEEITQYIGSQGLRLDDRSIRRYHLSLRSRGFVILAGVSGTGKTWLAEEYAKAIGATLHREAVAPNWTSNEDLIGYFNPVSLTYHHTATSLFIQEAAKEYEVHGENAREFHLLLDEMNLARIEHYFATFLSSMEELQRYGRGRIDIAGANPLYLTPNIKLIGTVNIDETTHGFANKVFDRAQLIELAASESAIQEHLGDRPWAGQLFNIWKVVQPAAPFAFRVIDDMNRYIQLAGDENSSWQDALDEQIEQKILPKLSGNQANLHSVLGELALLLGQDFPLSSKRLEAMKSQHEDIGFVSFFS